MTGKNPLVSIVIPTKNRSDLVTETLRSIQDQSYSNWEAIVVDDGSTDDTERAVNEIVGADSRVRFVHRNRQPPGAPTCRNIGAALATGDFVIFLDSDDLLMHDCLERRVAFMDRNPDLAFAVYAAEMFQHVPGDRGTYWNVMNDADDLDRFLQADAPWHTTGPIWRRSALKEIGPWDESLPSWQDWDFHVRALCTSPAYQKIPERDYYIRRGLSSHISAADQELPRLRARASMFANSVRILRYARVLTQRRSQLMAGLFLLYSRKCVRDRGSLRAGAETWIRCYRIGIIDLRRLWIGWALLPLSFNHRTHRLADRFIRRIWREYASVGITLHGDAPSPGSGAISGPADINLRYHIDDVGRWRPLNGAREVMPDLSILICTHNRSGLLRQVLASLSAVRIPESKTLELVVVGNACSDDTAAVVSAARQTLPFRVTFLVEDQLGLSFARNRAIEFASGKILAFLDDDVLVDPRWATELLQTYVDHDADMVGGHVALWWEVDPPSWWRPADYNWILSSCDFGNDAFQMTSPTGLIGANFSFHRRVFEQIGGFRPDLGRVRMSLLAGEETEFTERALAAGFKAFHSPTVGVRHWVPRSRVTPQYLTRAAAGVARGDMIMRATFGPRAAARSLCGYLYKFARDTLVCVLATVSQNKSVAIQYRVRAAADAGSFMGAIQRLAWRPNRASNPVPSRNAPSKSKTMIPTHPRLG